MRTRTALFTILAATLLSGCATLFAPNPQQVPVRSEPEDAEVRLDGELVGRTPVVLSLDPNRSHEVVLTLGDRQRTITLSSELNGTYVALDLLPGLGLAGASVALASACNEPTACLVAASAGSAGVAAGVGAAATATATDAVTGAWYTLEPAEVDVRFD